MILFQKVVDTEMYTYLIGWTKLNKFYYGVRYSKKSTTEELWITYFTSSKHVKDFRIENGEPDIIQIRKVFNDKQKAQLWEHKVLKRLNCAKSEKWLNKTDNISIHYSEKYSNTLPGRLAALSKITNKKYNEIFDEETVLRLKKNRSETSKKNWSNPELRKKMSKKKETTKYREAALKRWSSKKQ
jgi:hypothetical protein